MNKAAIAAGLLAFALSMALGSITAKACEQDPEQVNQYAGITMTDEEGRELELILAMEAQDEPFEGQKAVVEVIFNRVLSPEWPDTVHGVLSQKKQFSTWRYINHPYNIPNEVQCDAIAEVLDGAPPVLPDMSYVYFSTGRHKWMHDCLKINRHWFGK